MVTNATSAPKIAVVIPSYRVRANVGAVLSAIGPEVSAIYVVDDACPEGSGRYVEEISTDPRVSVIFNPNNLGVGGATVAGFRQAVADGAEVIVKIDGDGQMNPAAIREFVGPILTGEADYTKGNRFFDPEGVASMPVVRLIGNACLSFMAKLSTGYWHIFDPTNGYFAIHADIVKVMPLEKISQRYFFETDLLFRLNILTARVVDIPMLSHYGSENSGLNPLREVLPFAWGHARIFCKRILYNYFIRNFSVASLELVLGLLMLVFGIVFGVVNWGTDAPATAGTVMMAALPSILGIQFLLAFVGYDIQAVPRTALHPKLTSYAEALAGPGDEDAP
jgi:dolichol-phosphate mannosyltransferase